MIEGGGQLELICYRENIIFDSYHVVPTIPMFKNGKIHEINFINLICKNNAIKKI